MRKNPGKYRKWYSAFCTIVLIGSLLLAGCASLPGDPCETQPTNSTEATTAPDTTETTQPANITPTADTTIPANDSEDPSLVIFRQAMVETPQIFAVSFFGHVPQNSDPFAVMQEAAPQLCEDLPFLLTIDRDHILGTEGQLFCIVPADENATVAVNRGKWNDVTGVYECTEQAYRSECGDPVLVMCNKSDWDMDAEIVITDSEGNVVVWYPHMDSDYRVASAYGDNAESLILDFTSYDELPDPGWNQAIDSSELVGTWELAWTEVEGDQNEAEPGACIIEITLDEAGHYWFTYTERDFPDWNVQDRELLVTPGELYPGCNNDQWFAKVTAESQDAAEYALTVLKDGTLLLQSYWTMDGTPMISSGWYERIN